MTKERSEIDHAWQAIVSLVMDSRGAWRRKVAAATGLPFTRVRALKRLVDGPVTLRDLAYSLDTDAPATTVTVNDLEQRGLVTRQEHPGDRRAKLVALTTAGRAVARAYKNVPDPAPELLTSLSKEDVKTLARIFLGAESGAKAAREKKPR